jgi:hypothetical protein
MRKVYQKGTVVFFTVIIFFMVLKYGGLISLISNGNNEENEEGVVDNSDPRTPPNVPFAKDSNNKTLVLYAYFEKTDQYARTLDYFIKLGVEQSKRIDYVFIIQGNRTTISFPNYTNVRILRRPNACFDFGAYGKAIEWLGGMERLRESYAYFFFINPSALGPILPKYWPKWIHWTEIFTSRLVNDTHACSTSIVCLPKIDPGGWGPKIEGEIFFEFEK